MSPSVSLALTGLRRRPERTALRIVVVAAAVGLLAGMLLFIGDSLRTASATAARDRDRDRPETRRSPSK